MGSSAGPAMVDIPMGEKAPIPMGDVPAHYANLKGDDICLTYPEGTLTWLELESSCNRMARGFKAYGVGQNDLVTVALPNSLFFHQVVFALWKLGAIPHIISPNLTSKEIKEIVALAEPSLCVGVEAELAGGCQSVGEHDDFSSFSADPVPACAGDHWRAMSSGGSTGRPKIIVDHNPSLWGFSYPLLNFPENACVLNPGPLYHSGPMSWTTIALCQGNHLVGMRKFEAGEVLRLIEQYQVNWVQLVPTMMHRIWNLGEVERARYDLSCLKTVLHMAAPMPVWLKEQWIDWLGAERILELYGGTEALGLTVISGEEWLAHKGSVGKPIMGTIKILDDLGNDCKPGERGNVCFEIPGEQGGSYHYIGATAMLIKPGWETLGDMGSMDEEGYLYLADRKTDMVISGGANVYPAEVEAALMEHPGVEEAVVIGLPDADLGQRVHGIIKAIDSNGGGPTEEDLRHFLQVRLVRYKTPRSYEFVDHTLRDDAGKIRRPQLIKERT